MSDLDLLHAVDHTWLKPTATYSEICNLADEAIKYETASVCIPPSFVKQLHKDYPTLNICTVIGFPLGYNTTDTKVFETTNVLSNGANEIDMVINLGDVKEKKYDAILDEIIKIKETCGEHILKVIIETCYLTEDEKIELCKIVTKSGADYIKTSTGFGTDGATREDIQLFKNNIGPAVKMKAAGGVKNLDDLRYFIEAGCSRIGSSSAIRIVLEESTK